MSVFEIDIAEEGRARELDEPRRIRLSAGDTVFTRLIRPGNNDADEYVEAPPAQLAFWLVDHWWRLTAECTPSSGQTAEWQLAHDLSSIGSFAWPRLAIWGEGRRIGMLARSDPVGVVGPVRYLTDALRYIATTEFEAAALSFVDTVADQGSRMASDWAALRAQLDALEAERADSELTAWRQLEAQLGYDVDEAPEELMGALDRFAREYGAAAIAEAALAMPGASAAETLQTEIDTAMESHWQCDLARMARAVGPVKADADLAPWELAEKAAAAVRGVAGCPKGPLTNAALGDILSVKTHAFRTRQSAAPVERAYGLRLNTGRKRGEVVSLAASWSADRRFEFARALGDAIWSRGGDLGPLTRAKSARQKFQRAFAQSLLCPYEDLFDYIDGRVSDGAISAAARHFLVSERVVRSLLVNKHDLGRTRLQIAPRTFVRFDDAVAFEDAVEAA